MATTNDIDTKAAVRKFLETRSVVDKEDETADSADEVQAVLESVALSFLLYPQAALSFILRAKNILQQVVTTDLGIIDYLLKAVKDIENPDEPIVDTSDLIEAQTALVEVDRLGRVDSDVRAYSRYTQAINRFLDRKLAKSLKRHRRGEFERTGTEAKQDLFRILSAFGTAHVFMVERMALLLDGVSDFQGVSLTKVVSTRTLTRVRSSLRKVIQGVQKRQLSKTSTAVELLSGAAALSSISNSRQIYDPTVDTGSYPTTRTITISSERVSAEATGSADPVSLAAYSIPWIFDITIDGSNHQVTLPAIGASGRSYVIAAIGAATYSLPADTRTLYVQFDGITPPTNYAAMIRAVTLPTGGAVTVAAILAALNDGVTGLLYGTAIELSQGRILIYGSSLVTKITILSIVQGSFDGIPPPLGTGIGIYTAAPLSAHLLLGFSDDQKSSDPTIFTPTELADLLESQIDLATFSIVDGAIQINTVSEDLLSSLSFNGEVADSFGFDVDDNYLVEPSYIEFIEDGEAIDPSSLGIFVGSMVTASDVIALPNRNLFSAITSIDGTQVFFAEEVNLPRCDKADVRVLSPLVYAVQSLYDSISEYRSSFDGDARDLQRVLSPLLSKPTLAQINDAKRVLQNIRDIVDELLTAISAVVVREDQTEFSAVATQISASMEERGLDRALDLLQSGQFSAFFALTKEEASKGSRFLKASEQVGRNEFSQTTVEQDMDDVEAKATTSDENLLPGEELLEDEEQQ